MSGIIVRNWQKLIIILIILNLFYRPGNPEECSGIVSFLSSDDASYITGETVVVSGGMASRL